MEPANRESVQTDSDVTAVQTTYWVIETSANDYYGMGGKYIPQAIFRGVNPREAAAEYCDDEYESWAYEDEIKDRSVVLEAVIVSVDEHVTTQ